jgi:hypothetical protein
MENAVVGARAWFRSPPLVYAGVFAVGALLAALAITQGINPNDEGIVLQAASRITNGQLPYRDFYANYGPGEYYLIALLNLIAGPSLLSWRVLGVALDATVATLAFALVRREASLAVSLLASVAVAAAMAFPQVPHPNTPLLVLAFGGVLLAERRPVVAGLLAGVAVAFRPDAGIAVLAAVVVAALPGRGRAAAWRAGGTGVGVGLLLLAPFVIAAPDAFWDDTLGFDLGTQSLQRLPLPSLSPGPGGPSHVLHHDYVYVLLAGAFVWLVIALAARAPLRRWSLAPVALAGIAYLVGRPDDFHLSPLAAVLPAMLGAVVPDARLRLGRAVAWVVCLALGLIALEGLDLKRVQLVTAPHSATLNVDVGDGVQVPVADERALSALVRYVRARVPEGQPVFVSNPRFDLVNVGDPLLYVLLQRPNPTRYDVMQPGVVTTAAVQREMVRSLESARPRLVVRWLSPLADQVQPDGAGHSTGVHLLDSYLAARYVPVRRFGEYLVLRLVGRP